GGFGCGGGDVAGGFFLGAARGRAGVCPLWGCARPRLRLAAPRRCHNCWTVSRNRPPLQLAQPETVFFMLSASLLCLRHPLLHLARQVRNNPDHAFDQHELAAMMHFMFFDRSDHVEAVSRRWCSACRHGDDLAKKFFRNAANETRPLLAFLPEQFKDLGLRSWLCFLSHYLLHQSWKVEAFQRCPLIDGVNLITESRRQRDMGQ